MELERGRGTVAPRPWFEKAREAEPKPNFQVIEAMLAYEDGTTDNALSALGTPSTVDAWNLQLSCWLTKGEGSKALTSIASAAFPPNAETLRLKSLAHLIEREVAAAEHAIAESLAQQPEWASIRHTNAIVLYASTVCTHFHAW